jgi:hypothetical protein
MMAEPYTVIQFTPFDMLFVVMFAARQRAVKEALGTTDRKVKEEYDSFDLHLMGAMGECAVARALGVKPDTSLKVGSDDGIDLVIDGTTIQIKAYLFNGPGFEVFVNDDNSLKADILVATRIKTPASVEIIGWIPRDEFFAKAHRRDFGYGPRLALEPLPFRRISTLRLHTSGVAA